MVDPLFVSLGPSFCANLIGFYMHNIEEKQRSGGASLNTKRASNKI